MRKYTFGGGIHPLSDKHEGKAPTRMREITDFAPDQVTIPMDMHLGAPSVPIVAKGDYVKLGQVIATVLPQLDNFNITAAIATGSLVPPAYLGWALVYCLAYSVAGVLLAFILFEDRDLA